MWYKSKILKKLFLSTTDWSVAWKKDKDDKYHIIENPTGYWLADPIIFENENELYLFVEAYDKNKKIGKLGVLKYDGNSFTDFRIILEKEYHLSYPYVFKYKNNYYMIPETSGNKCIEIYKAESFPYKWVKIKKLLDGEYVDTTINLFAKNEINFYTYNNLIKKEYYGNLDMDNIKMNIINEKEDLESTLRGGGNVFYDNNSLCRAVQNNKYFYGQSLYIIDYYNQNIIKEILPMYLNIDNGCTYRRVHTYSKTSEISVVDISNYKFDLFKTIKKIFNSRR